MLIHQLYVIEFSNGKKYFGITCQKLRERWKAHLSASKRDSVRPICLALRKYTATIRTLAIGSREYICDLEIKAIEHFKTRDRKFGYNIGIGGDFGTMLGNKHSIAARAKIGEASKKRERTLDEAAKKSASMMGHSVSSETKIKISIATKEAMKDPAVRKKISDAKIDKPLSPEHIASLIGRKDSPETRAKKSAKLKGKKRSPEVRAAMKTWKWWYKDGQTTRAASRPGEGWIPGRGPAYSASCEGKRPSQETLAKMSVAAKARMTLEVRAAISRKLTGSKRPPEVCAKISAFQKGRPKPRRKLLKDAA